MKATEIYGKHNGENSVTSLWRNSFLINMRLTYEDKASIKLDRQQKNINPVDYAVWGALQKDVYRVPIVGLEDLKDRVHTCWASLDQQLINKAIDPWRQTLKTVVKVHEGTLSSCLLDCLVVVWSFRYTQARISIVFHHCGIQLGSFDPIVYRIIC